MLIEANFYSVDEFTRKGGEAGDEIKEKDEGDREPNLVFLGARESGKSSLLNNYIFKDKGI